MGKNLKGKELGEGLSQLKDGRYVGRYTNRYGQRKSIYGKTLKEVKDKFNKAKYEEQFFQGEVIHNNMTLNDVFELWIKYKEGRIKDSTLMLYYDYFINHITNALGNYKIINIDTPLLEKFFFDLKRTLSYSSIMTIKANVMNGIFKFAVKHQICLNNPVAQVQITKTEKDVRRKMNKSQSKYLTKEQINIFFDFIERKNYRKAPLYKLMLFTGMRIGETIALRWSDIDFNNKIISINKTYTKYCKNHKFYQTYNQTPKTLTSIRKIPMNSQSLALLKEQRNSKYTDDDFVFFTERKTPLSISDVDNSLNYAVKQLNKELKKKSERESVIHEPFPHISSHYFRHTFATMCLEQGIPPKVVQKYLGHSNIQTTMNIYMHVSNDLMFEEIEKLDNIIEA